MCGRFALQTPAETLQRLFDFSTPPARSWAPERTDRPRFNIAPTQPILVARAGAEGREGAWASWGMRAAKGRLAINARAESVFERPAFRTAARRGRVLVFADGFFEWERAGERRLPYYIARPDGAPLVFAGVSALGPAEADGERRLACAILTTAANEDVARLHDRMPVLLHGPELDAWLDPRVDDPAALEPLLAPPPAGSLTLREVSTRVNEVEHDDPACLAPPEPGSTAKDAKDQLGFDF
jgi:putative SOS response-associated peptidase YedK